MTQQRRQKSSWWRRCKILCFFGVLIASTISSCQPRGAKPSLERFFCSVDQDGDGEIQRHEATKFLSLMGSRVAEKFKEEGIDEDKDFSSDVHAAPHSDFSYGGKTISSEEMLDHLQNMLTADRVVDWIKHGLQLPQYADAFRRNAINGLDFLSLIENDSYTLVKELGVSSVLHRTKITGAIVRQIFGFGAPPGSPTGMRCEASSCGGIQLQWDCPLSSGYPPLHKYCLQKWDGAVSAWKALADTKETSFLDTSNVRLGKSYSYRIRAWGGHGPSDWVTVNGCNASAQFKIQSKPSHHQVSAELVNAEYAERGIPAIPGSKRGNTRWGWIGFLNCAIFLLGLLSRQSFFFRMTVAVWVIFRFKVLEPIRVKLFQARTSKYLWVRTLANFFVTLYGSWSYVQCSVFYLSGQTVHLVDVCTFDAKKKKKILMKSDSLGYSPADHSLEEMLAAIQKSERDDVDLVDRNLNRKRILSSGAIQSLSEHHSLNPLDARCLSAPAIVQAGDDEEENNEEEDREDREYRSYISGSQREHEAHSKRKRTRHRCNYDGCKSRFDRWHNLSDWRMKFYKHYCRECQRVFCIKHTRISPHGPFGRCGLDSNCICILCFKYLTPEAQQQLDRINKLRAGPPVSMDHLQSSFSSSSSSSSSSTAQAFPPDLGISSYLNDNSDDSLKRFES